MSKPEVIEIELVSAASGADARDVDIADVRVRVRGSCVVLQIGWTSGRPLAGPVLLSAAASRALAAELTGAADAVERPSGQD
jgi:hypothetical protein